MTRVTQLRGPALLALASLALVPAACGRGGGAGGDTVTIAVVGPLELVYGRSMKMAAEMAADEINAAGGVDGHRLVLDVRDDAADPETAIGIAEDLVADPAVVGVVGHVTSGATLGAAPAYNAGGLVELSPSASSPAITTAGDWTFRVCPSDLAHGPALAAWLEEHLGGRRAAVLYANDAYGRGVLSSFDAAYRKRGGVMLSRNPFLPRFAGGDTLDPYIRRAMLRRADGLVVAGLADEAMSIIRAARRLGFTGPILGADGLLGVEQAGDVANGVFVSAPFLPDAPGAAARTFVAAYEARYQETPDAYAALTYDAVRLLAGAVADVGADREAVRDRIAAVGSERPAFDGVTGSIAFDANGDVTGKDVFIGTVRDGRIVTVSSGSAMDATPDPAAAPPEPAAETE